MPVQATCAPVPGQFRAYISGLKGRQLGAFKGAAKRIGVTLDDYIDAIDAGRKWCFACSQWCDRCRFCIDRTRWDGLGAKCHACAAVFHERTHSCVPEWELTAREREAPRDGDKLQARYLVNLDIKIGRRPDPNTFHCALCGHKGSDRRHEYHHYMGYAARHHYDVIPVCSACHHEEHGQ
jgi:hypothetical protein